MERVQDSQVIHYLQNYQIALLLDGLNELTNNDQERCINEVQTLLETYTGQVCISYPLSDHAYFGFSCPTYKALPLTKGQIEETIKEYFAAKGAPDKSDWFLQSVRGWDIEKQQDFDDLAKLPINIQFLLELADADSFIFSGRSAIYMAIHSKAPSKEQRFTANKIKSQLKLKPIA